MFENIINYLKNMGKKNTKSKETAKERLQLVLTQDRANVSADYLDLMKQEIIEVIKKYINIDESALEVELTKPTEGVPSLIANIPIVSVKSNRDINKEKTEKNNTQKNNTNQTKANTSQNVNNKNKTKTQNTSKKATTSTTKAEVKTETNKQIKTAKTNNQNKSKTTNKSEKK